MYLIILNYTTGETLVYSVEQIEKKYKLSTEDFVEKKFSKNDVYWMISSKIIIK
jgi:hypothetical protein